MSKREMEALLPSINSLTSGQSITLAFAGGWMRFTHTANGVVREF